MSYFDGHEAVKVKVRVVRGYLFCGSSLAACGGVVDSPYLFIEVFTSSWLHKE
jgi:hypothetical protein